MVCICSHKWKLKPAFACLISPGHLNIDKNFAAFRFNQFGKEVKHKIFKLQHSQLVTKPTSQNFNGLSVTKLLETSMSNYIGKHNTPLLGLSQLE